tara:strand:+ start:451 stop:615 length:165 start_codon:yes stop_codon:yes gene_type:complete
VQRNTFALGLSFAALLEHIAAVDGDALHVGGAVGRVFAGYFVGQEEEEREVDSA